MPSQIKSQTPSEDATSFTSASTTPQISNPKTPNETHTCPYTDCHKSFSKKYNLKAHLRLHTGEEPFECDRPDCRKKFKWRSSLSSHSIWHTRKDNGTVCDSRPAVQKDATSLAVQVAVPSKVKLESGFVPSVPRPVSKLEAIPSPNVQTNKKRPRVDVSRVLKSEPGLARDSVPKNELCLGAELKEMADKEAEAMKASRRKGSRVPKKRKTTAKKPPVKVAEGGYPMFSPGSPVTTDSGLSENSLDLELFSCDVLPPLIGSEGDGFGLGTDDVGALLNGDVSMFGYAAPSCGTLNGLDTRFGPFELDNLQSFGLNKVEGL